MIQRYSKNILQTALIFIWSHLEVVLPIVSENDAVDPLSRWSWGEKVDEVVWKVIISAKYYIFFTREIWYPLNRKPSVWCLLVSVQIPISVLAVKTGNGLRFIIITCILHKKNRESKFYRFLFFLASFLFISRHAVGWLENKVVLKLKTLRRWPRTFNDGQEPKLDLFWTISHDKYTVHSVLRWVIALDCNLRKNGGVVSRCYA